eukprot:6615613-Prymnesium_polylepis.3
MTQLWLQHDACTERACDSGTTMLPANETSTALSSRSAASWRLGPGPRLGSWRACELTKARGSACAGFAIRSALSRLSQKSKEPGSFLSASSCKKSVETTRLARAAAMVDREASRPRPPR